MAYDPGQSSSSNPKAYSLMDGQGGGAEQEQVSPLHDPYHPAHSPVQHQPQQLLQQPDVQQQPQQWRPPVETRSERARQQYHAERERKAGLPCFGWFDFSNDERKFRMPYFVIFNTLLICCMYLYGVMFMMGGEEGEDGNNNGNGDDGNGNGGGEGEGENPMMARLLELSPPKYNWVFYTVYRWPSCRDMRFQHHRVFTQQFLHMGLGHVAGNAIAYICFGSLFEIYAAGGHLAALLVFEVAVVLGGLGHALWHPYSGLVGCSMGVYGCIGGSWSLVIFQPKNMNDRLRLVIAGVLCLQLLVDGLSLVFMYSPTTSYASHISGFAAGLLLSTSFYVLTAGDNKAARYTGMVASVLFAAQVIFLCSWYFAPPGDFPPPPVGGAEASCCAQAWGVAQETGTDYEDVVAGGGCYDQTLYVDGGGDDGGGD